MRQHLDGRECFCFGLDAEWKNAKESLRTDRNGGMAMEVPQPCRSKHHLLGSRRSNPISRNVRIYKFTFDCDDFVTSGTVSHAKESFVRCEKFPFICMMVVSLKTLSFLKLSAAQASFTCL